MGFNQAPALPYRNLGIAQDGDTASRAIPKDKYVIWKGGNYFAKTDILQGEAFAVDTNLTEITEGAINGIVNALNASSWSRIDFANKVTLTANAYYTLPSDGFVNLCISWQADSVGGIQVFNSDDLNNGVTMFYLKKPKQDTNDTESASIFLKKGIVVKIIGSNLFPCYFIPVI